MSVSDFREEAAAMLRAWMIQEAHNRVAEAFGWCRHCEGRRYFELRGADGPYRHPCIYCNVRKVGEPLPYPVES